jgi:FRG domain-containing protein
MKVSTKAKQIRANSWEDLLNLIRAYSPAWAFRGACFSTWELKTSLERLEAVPVYQAERYLLSAFQRRIHHYVDDPPDREDDLEWLALMQHHGAPTRLQDWTKSPYVALFFALEQPGDSVTDPALWAIDLDWCKQQAFAKVRAKRASDLRMLDKNGMGKPGIFKTIFLRQQGSGITMVAPLQPFRMNQRLVIQQGLFLVPGNPEVSFEQNLLAYGSAQFQKHVHKITIPHAQRLEILGALNKMNINRASLFPGIDGFAQSLGTNIQIAIRTGRLSTEIQKLGVYTEYSFL